MCYSLFHKQENKIIFYIIHCAFQLCPQQYPNNFNSILTAFWGFVLCVSFIPKKNPCKIFNDHNLQKL